MTFEEAQRHLEILNSQLRQGQISQKEYQDQASRLQVQDKAGRWWQPQPGGGGWLTWDGMAWQSRIPGHAPSAGALVPSTPAGASPAPGQKKAGSGFAAAWQRRRAGQFLDPQSFLEISKRLPLSRRPQSWWNLLSVLGGAGSGYLWFVYGSVRGMPHLTFMQQGRDSVPDWLPAVVLAILPLLAIVFRRALARRLTSLWSRLAKWPLPAKLAVLVAVLVFFGFFVTTNLIFTQREGLDIITPILMAGIPMMLVLFRPETDKMLLPFQSLRRSIPRGILVGIGLALPFLIAFFLYYVVGLSMYPLLRANVLIGTLGSYALLRNPIAQATPKWTILRIPGILLAVGIFLYFVAPAMADDFLRDPFNLNDGLRTDVIAPILSGVATAVVSILVNGVEVAQVMIQGTAATAEGEEPERKDFLVAVNAVDKAGARSTAISSENGGVDIIVPLTTDLNGWEKLTVRAENVVSKGDTNKPGCLKKEFQVLDAEGSPEPALAKGWISVSDKLLLDDRVTHEFTVTVDPNAPVMELERCGYFLLSVQAQLDLPDAEKAPMVEAKVKLNIPVPIARVTLRKFRWGELKDFDLFSHMERSDLGQLYKAGGDLFVPTVIQPVQSVNVAGNPAGENPTAAGTLEFDNNIRVFDTEGELNWMGALIRGIHDDDKDPDRRYIIFRIPAARGGESDHTPDSPTQPAGSDGIGDV